MTKPFKYSNQTYRDDVIAAALISREKEIFHYEFDIENFTYILNNTADLGMKKDMEKRISDTHRQLAIAQGTYNALEAQIIDQAAHQAALVRVRSSK